LFARRSEAGLELIDADRDGVILVHAIREHDYLIGQASHDGEQLLAKVNRGRLHILTKASRA
jgi:hypothetical protein